MHMTQTLLDQNAGRQIRATQPSTSRREAAKTEFLDGRTIAKPSSDRWHNLISTNFVVAIGSRAHRGTCEVYAGDMQVRIGKDSICFPDVVVVSGEPEFADQNSELLQNPTV